MNDSRMQLIGNGGEREILGRIGDLGSVRRILCMTATGLGDVVMAAPALAALKERYGGAQLTWLSYGQRGGAELAELIPAIDEVVDIGLGSYRYASAVYMAGGYWRVLKALRRRRFDLAICLTPNYIRRWLLAGLNCPNWLYGNSFAGYPLDLAMKLLKQVGVEKAATEGVFAVKAPARASEIVQGEWPRPWIGVHPFAGYSWKEWPYMDELLDRLKGFGGTVIQVGRKAGAAGHSTGINLINQLSLAELFWVIGQCDGFVTADSGPMHIALAMGVPTVAMFSVMNPRYLVSEGDIKRHQILYKPTELSESLVHVRYKKGLKNMAMISVDEVWTALGEVVDLGGVIF